WATLPTRSRRRPPLLQIPTTKRVSPRQWRPSFWVRQGSRRYESGHWAHRDITGSAGAGASRGEMDDASRVGRGRFFPCVALGWIDPEDTLQTSRVRRIQGPFPLAAGVLVLGRRTLRPARSSRQQLSDDARSDARQGSGAEGEHPSDSDRRCSRGGGATL